MSNYYAFGWEIEPLSWSIETFKFGFNGKEKDGDITGGALDFGARIYSAKIGRWLSIDPLFAKYPSMSPYQANNGNPIVYVDDGGMENIVYLVFSSEAKKKLKPETVSELIEHFKNHLGIHTNVAIFTGDVNNFNVNNLDKTDTYVIFGSDREDVLNTIDQIQNADMGFVSGILKDNGFGKYTNPEKSNFQGDKKGIAVSVTAAEALSLKGYFNQPTTELWSAYLAIHGLFHNAGYVHPDGKKEEVWGFASSGNKAKDIYLSYKDYGVKSIVDLLLIKKELNGGDATAVFNKIFSSNKETVGKINRKVFDESVVPKINIDLTTGERTESEDGNYKPNE